MIRFPHKDDKKKGKIVNALRIMAWDCYKVDNRNYKPENPDDSFELYNKFKTEWEQSEIHNKSLADLLQFIDDLGYSEKDLLDVTKNYCEKRSNYQQRNDERNNYQQSKQYDEDF